MFAIIRSPQKVMPVKEEDHADLDYNPGRLLPVDDSRKAYETSKDFAVDTGQAISQGAREAYEEGKHIGPKIAEDIKQGFQGGGQAPDPTNETAPAAEKP